MNFATVSGRTAATGGSEGETAEAAADSTLYLSNDTIVKPSGGYDGEASVRDAVEEIGGYGGEEE